MPDYAVCGGCLRASIDLPELQRVTGTSPSWVFRLSADVPPERPDQVLLGEEHIYGSVHARLYGFEGGYRVTVDDTGSFDLSPDGTEITGYPLPEAWPDFVRAHLIGRVLAVALHLGGILTLHGSAVALGDDAVAFLAPKHHGKTTLALAITRAGGALLTDDMLPVVPGDLARALPGVHSMRLHSDTAGMMAGSAPLPQTREGKHRLDDLPADWIRNRDASLAAIYLLTPVASIDGGAMVRRDHLAGVSSAVSLMAHTKIGRMLGSWGAPTLLERAATTSRHTSVYRLAVVRDLAGLPEVVERIGEWHGHRLQWDSRRAEAV